MVAELPDWAPSALRHPWLTLLALCALSVAVFGEARMGRAKLRNGRYVMTSGWVIRLLAILPATVFTAILCHLLISALHGDSRALLACIPAGGVAIGCCLLCVDIFVRRATYDERGVELVALLARRRRVFLQWGQIRHVEAHFDKIKLATDDRPYAVYGHLKGCKGFLARLKEACPNAGIVDYY